MIIKSPVHDVIQPRPADQGALDAFEAALDRFGNVPCLMAPDQAPLEFPEPLYLALRGAVHILRTGAAVAISPLQRRLSTTEAGDLLGVSRQYLTRLIDRGEIPCERTGKHRRLHLSDVLAYKRRRDDDRLAILNALTAEAAEMGGYD